MDNNFPPAPQNWFQRNWKWFVPTGCLTLLIIGGGLLAALYFGIESVMKSNDVYKHSIEVAQKNPRVIEKIGDHIDSEGMVSGNISTTNSSGNALLDIPVKGSKGTGSIHVEAEKINDIWTYNQIEFYAKGSTERIDLLNNKPAE